MSRETQHCPDDEPLRITLAKAILTASHTLDYVTSDDGVIISTSANMLALKRLQCMGHRLRPAASILAPPLRPAPPQSSIESLPPPTERHFIASLSVALSLWSIRS